MADKYVDIDTLNDLKKAKDFMKEKRLTIKGYK